MNQEIKLEHQLDLVNQTVLFEAISHVAASNVSEQTTLQLNNENNEMIDQLQNRISYLTNYNAYLKSQADLIETNLKQLRMMIPQILKRQSEQVQSKIKTEIEKKDELMEMIPKLESNYHNLLSKIQCIDQQIKTSRSLNTELRMKNIQLATEFNSLDLPYDELLTVKQTNGIESEIKEHKNKIEIAGPGDNTPPQEDHS
ncbi:hypothetical protein M9Y10_001182 [Tritrichomonas musculus]|uniref:Uncharacterized protein n=1 Tax=Tritrichomonas musculus TaxID=1915356 RepID=A0ABR2L6B4_9EUKA